MSSRFTIKMIDSESHPELTKDSAHVFSDVDDRMEDLKEPHVHVEFKGADLIDLSTNQKILTFTVRITQKLGEALGLMSKKTFSEIHLSKESSIYIMGDGSVYRATDTGLEYTTPQDAPEPSTGGIAISRYNEMAVDYWEYTDRCPDADALKEYIRILAHRRRKLK